MEAIALMVSTGIFVNALKDLQDLTAELVSIFNIYSIYSASLGEEYSYNIDSTQIVDGQTILVNFISNIICKNIDSSNMCSFITLSIINPVMSKGSLGLSWLKGHLVCHGKMVTWSVMAKGSLGLSWLKGQLVCHG